MLILIPAAGASTRMRGRDKLLEKVNGTPLLARQVSMALETENRVLVTLPPDKPAREEVLKALICDRLETQVISAAAEGMAASIRCGAERAEALGADALMILLPDMPDITARDLVRLTQHFDGDTALRATTPEGTPGHPVIFPPRLFSRLKAVQGDQGARAVLKDEMVCALPLPDNRAITDLDTPEDWDAWRRRTRR